MDFGPFGGEDKAQPRFRSRRPRRLVNYSQYPCSNRDQILQVLEIRYLSVDQESVTICDKGWLALKRLTKN